MKTVIQYKELVRVDLLQRYYFNGSKALKADKNGSNPAFSRWLDTPYEALSASVQTALEKAYNVHHDLLIYPTDDTQRLLEHHKIVFRKSSRGFFLGCRVKEEATEAYIPYVPFSEAFTLRFILELRDPDFVRFTNLPQAEEADVFLYHFSNRYGHEADGSLFLTGPTPEFESGKPYFAGDLVVQKNGSSTQLFEALRDNQNVSLNDSNTWRNIPLKSYATRSDRLIARPALFNLDLASIAGNRLSEIQTVHLRLADKVGPKYETSFSTDDPARDPILNRRVHFPETTAPPGRYTLELTFESQSSNPLPELNFSQDIYLDTSLFLRRAFGMIELTYLPDDSLGRFGFLNEQGHLQKPVFTIWFKNRSAWWEFQRMPIAGNNGKEGAAPGSFLSEEPIPFTKANRAIGLDIKENTYSVVPDPAIGAYFQLLPNPGPDQLRPENDKWYSKVFFHLKSPSN